MHVTVHVSGTFKPSICCGNTSHPLVVQVLVAKVYRLDIRHTLDSKIELSPGMVYVEVTAKAGEGEHVEACEAIGTQSLLKCILARWHVSSSSSTSRSCPLIMPLPCR